MAASPLLEQKLSRALTWCLLLLALSAPVSIAATQTAWALALLCWLARALVARARGRWTFMEGAVLLFVGGTLVSSLFSYEPIVSLRKMTAVGLVSIVYLVAENIANNRTRRLLLIVLLAAGGLSVVFTVGALAVGKNLKIQRLTSDSPLRAVGVQEKDTILNANGRNINSPDELLNAVLASPNGVFVPVTGYRQETLVPLMLSASSLASGATSTEKLGIVEWSRGRDTRAAGFYGHYTTYAEVLQMLLALTLGLFVAHHAREGKRQKAKGKSSESESSAKEISAGKISKQAISWRGWLIGPRIVLLLLLAGMGWALLWTATRASWAGFMAAASVIVLVGASRRAVLILLACAVPLVLAGVFILQQKRRVSFVDKQDGSTQWRLVVWREGFNLLTTSPRHLLVGIGMDSIKTHWQEWRMFDNGRLPIGHMHSTPLQLALERGVPVLIFWLLWLAWYVRELWHGLRRDNLAWPERGLLLGALGGTVGFLVGGLVHYNWGDSEVVMVFYLMMGLSLATTRAFRVQPVGNVGQH